MAIVRYVGGFLALSAILFIPAGTLDYWEAWVYLAILFIPMFFVLLYLLRNDPDLLERRFRMREKEQTQKKIIGFPGCFSWWYSFCRALTGVLAGHRCRCGRCWQPICVLLGYAIVFQVFRQNSYASRVIEVAKAAASDQQRPVRHGPPPDVSGHDPALWRLTCGTRFMVGLAFYDPHAWHHNCTDTG